MLSSTVYKMSRSLCCLLVSLFFAAVASLSDLVTYDIATQANCREISRGATRNCIWPAGLNSFADQIAEEGRIAAYKIQWSNGKWSGWYVPGVNDLDHKFNPSSRSCAALPYRANTMRRMWSYFYDHTHRFIICKPT